MDHRKHWLRILPVLALMVSTCLGTITSASAQSTVDVAIFTIENGQPAYDACYVLVDYSNEGCDENGDGRVMFADIPYGTYTVHQTADLGPGRYVEDFTINVIGNRTSAGWESFSATIINTGGSSSISPEQTSDIAIETFLDGSPYYDACYVLVDFSNEGCDRNADGLVTFEDVPLGTYTVRQTADLPNGNLVLDFTINVTGAMQSGWETFPAYVETGSGGSSAVIEPSSQSGAVDIALITREPVNGDLLTGTCYVLVGYSNEGCDRNSDGQVTFADIPFGTYTVRQTQTPSGYPTINDYDINVQPTGYMEGPSIGVPLGFIVRQAPEQNAPNTRNVSVVFLDMQTHERVTTGVCVELVGASQVGCDRDLIDGQVDFLDVPAGGPYELSFSNLPTGSEVGTVGGPLAVRIDAGPDDPANVMVFVLLDTSSGDAGVEPTESAAVVGEDGFTLTLDGVSVSGDPGVAPIGTTVHVRAVTHELPDAIGGFADPVGTGLEITLGESIQPISPLTITFAPEEVATWDAAPDPANDLLPVVFASRTDGSEVELADAQMLPDGSVVVTADHLSWFQPSRVSKSGFSAWLAEQVQIFMQLRSNAPDCVEQPNEAPGWAFSAVPNQLVWPCAEETAEGLEVTLTNNSPHVWLVESDQATPGIPITSSINGLVIASILGVGIDQRTTTPLIPPDGVVTFHSDDQPGPIMFYAAINEPMTVANAVASALSIVLPDKKVEALGHAQCLIDVALTAVDVEDNLAEGDIGGFIGTIIRCVGDFTGGLGGLLISTVAAAPGALTALADGFVRELTGGDEFSITLSRIDEGIDEPGDPHPPVDAWPTDRNDGPPTLFVWLGANFYGFPDWVACDDARTYCLVGYTGGEHMLVQMRGLDVVGTVADAVPDPRQALLALGLTDEIVTQILGP